MRGGGEGWGVRRTDYHALQMPGTAKWSGRRGAWPRQGPPGAGPGHKGQKEEDGTA